MFAAMSDRLLSAVLKEQTAGACVPEHGTFCKCVSGKKYVYSCNGPCVRDGSC